MRERYQQIVGWTKDFESIQISHHSKGPLMETGFSTLLAGLLCTVRHSGTLVEMASS